MDKAELVPPVSCCLRDKVSQGHFHAKTRRETRPLQWDVHGSFGSSRLANGHVLPMMWRGHGCFGTGSGHPGTAPLPTWLRPPGRGRPMSSHAPARLTSIDF
jgi:hypothetical protein